jgi:hypothetical protein
MVFLGFAVIATVGDVPKVIDGLNLQKTNKVLAYLGPGYMNYRANVSSTIVMYAHFVMGDYQTSFFVLLIINAMCFFGAMGQIAATKSPLLFKGYCAAAKAVRPIAEELYTALENQDHVKAYELRARLEAELEKWDAFLERLYNGPVQEATFNEVKADLNTHKGKAQVFFEHTVALDGPLVLLCVAGPDVQKLRGAPVPNVCMKVECHSRDFQLDLYRVRSTWRAGDVLEAIRRPLAALNVSLLRLNHPEPDLDVFLQKESLVKVLSMTNVMVKEGTLTAGRLANLLVIPLKDDGTPDYKASFECHRIGEHSLTVDAVPLELLLEQAIDASSTDAAVQMCQLASNLSTEEQTQLEAKLVTTSALIILPGTFV